MERGMLLEMSLKEIALNIKEKEAEGVPFFFTETNLPGLC